MTRQPTGKQELCPSCGHLFTGTTAGDMHRVGKFHILAGPSRRRCLSEAEMLSRGMSQDIHGVWMSPAREGETRDLSTCVEA